MRPTHGTPANLLWPVLLLGASGDLLFRAPGLGLNVTLWTTGAAAAWWVHRRRCGETPEGAERALLIALLGLGAAFAWRENPTLRLLDGLALVSCFALLPLAARSGDSVVFGSLTVGRITLGLIQLARRMLAGLVPTLLDAGRLQRERPAGVASRAGAIARGTALTLPALLLFGGLLGHADPVFGNFLEGLVRIDVDTLVSHTFGLLGAGWLAAGLLAGALLRHSPDESLPWSEGTRGLGRIELGMILGFLNLLFAAFIAFQLPYLFGGAAWVERTARVTLADYARSGFFELVAVSGLVLPLLMVLSAQVPIADSKAGGLYRMLAGWQVVLVLVIMASAMHRMGLYQHEFGLTEDRFFASAFMGGLAITFCWFMATVLRGAAATFAGATVMAWAGWLVLLHVVNPERIIVETNIARAERGETLDVAYLGHLTSDAVPALVEGLGRIPEIDRSGVESNLRDQAAIGSHDWRDWHYGRLKAARPVASLH